MKRNNDFNVQCYKKSMPYIIQLFRKRAKVLSKMEDEAFLDLVQEAKMIEFKKAEYVKFVNGGYILKGEIQCLGRKYSKFHFVSASVQSYHV